MKKNILVVLMSVFVLLGFGQRYITKNGHIKFYSETPVETIEANNNQVNSVLDIATGDFVFKVLMKSFEFKKALMQEHFNENYIESDTYPNATFKGKVIDIENYDLTNPGKIEAQVEGELTIHGITKLISTPGTFTISNESIDGTSTFLIKPEDFNIKIPNTVINNIAEEIEISVNVSLKEFKR